LIAALLIFLAAAAGGYLKVRWGALLFAWAGLSAVVFLGPFFGEGWNARARDWTQRHALVRTRKYWALRVLATLFVLGSLTILPAIVFLMVWGIR
jgi:hypothetical protein